MGEFDSLGQALDNPMDTDQFKESGEKPYRDAESAEKAADNWRKFAYGEKIARQVTRRPKIAVGKVNPRPFSRERRRTNRWYEKMQNRVSNLIGYINDPKIQVRTNFSNLSQSAYMQTFFRFAHAFSKMKINKRDNWKETRANIEDLAKKNGMLPQHVLYGSASLFQLAYAAKKAKRRINGKTQVLDLVLSNRGSARTVLEYGGSTKLKPQALYSNTRPIPESMKDASNPFAHLNISGVEIDVKVTGKVPNSNIFTAVIASHSTGGGHNYFEFEKNDDGSFTGTTRWKKIEGRSPAEFIRNVLDMNAYMDKVASEQGEAHEKDQPLYGSKYEYKMPKQVERNVDFMLKHLKDKAKKNKGLSDEDIAFNIKFGLIRGDEDWIHPAYYKTITKADIDAFERREVAKGSAQKKGYIRIEET